MGNTIEAQSVTNPSEVEDTASHLLIEEDSTLVISNCAYYTGDYSFQMYIKGTSSSTVVFKCDTTTDNISVNTDWTFYSKKFTVSTASSKIELSFKAGEYWIYHMKLETGETTDWSRHPDDENYVDYKDNEISALEKTVLSNTQNIIKVDNRIQNIYDKLNNETWTSENNTLSINNIYYDDTNGLILYFSYDENAVFPNLETITQEELTAYLNNTYHIKLNSEGINAYNGETKLLNISDAIYLNLNSTYQAKLNNEGINVYNGETKLLNISDAIYLNGDIKGDFNIISGTIGGLNITNNNIYSYDTITSVDGGGINFGYDSDTSTSYFTLGNEYNYIKWDGWQLSAEFNKLFISGIGYMNADNLNKFISKNVDLLSVTTELDEKINDASKVAKNFLYFDDINGLVIHSSNEELIYEEDIEHISELIDDFYISGSNIRMNKHSIDFYIYDRQIISFGEYTEFYSIDPENPWEKDMKLVVATIDDYGFNIQRGSIQLGDYFSVNSEGILTAKNGCIGCLNINRDILSLENTSVPISNSNDTYTIKYLIENEKILFGTVMNNNSNFGSGIEAAFMDGCFQFSFFNGLTNIINEFNYYNNFMVFCESDLGSNSIGIELPVLSINLPSGYDKEGNIINGNLITISYDEISLFNGTYVFYRFENIVDGNEVDW